MYHTEHINSSCVLVFGLLLFSIYQYLISVILLGYCIFSWYQTWTGFRLACRSPHCRYVAWSSLAVLELKLLAATTLCALAFSPAASFRSHLSAVCRFGPGGEVYRFIGMTVLTDWSSLCGGCACAVVKKSPSKLQCGEWQASLKAALVPQMQIARYWSLLDALVQYIIELLG